MPQLSAPQAAHVAAQMIEHSVRLAMDGWHGPVALQAWPDCRHPLFTSLSDQTGIQLGQQSEGNLGVKMSNALELFTQSGAAAAIMGCDVPHCTGENLSRACDLLAQGRNVIGPSEDGGYYLIGLQQNHPELFSEICWGTNTVLQDTLDAANRLAMEVEFLETLNDIDTFEDLQKISGCDIIY